jgi:hypothetical protein
MTKKRKYSLLNWGILVLLYLCFLIWHGAFEGPLTPKEIDQYVLKLKALKSDADTATLRTFLEKDNGRPIIMVNSLKMRDQVQADHDNSTDVDATLARYQSHVFSYLIRHGSYPIYVGEAVGKSMAHWGVEGAEEWSRAALVRYRSLRTFMNMIIQEEFHEAHEYKIASIEKTIAYPTNIRLFVGGLGLIVFLVLGIIGLVLQLVINARF